MGVDVKRVLSETCCNLNRISKIIFYLCVNWRVVSFFINHFQVLTSETSFGYACILMHVKDA